MKEVHNFLGVFGHVNIDYLMNVDKLPAPNTSVEVSNVRRFFGGTGSNIAMMASGLGVRTALASFVGTDFPEDFRNALFKANVDTFDLAEMPGFMTPTCRILTDGECNQIAIMDQGPMGAMDGFPIAKHAIESSEIIHIGTGHPSYYLKVMKTARKLGKRIHFDPAQELRYMYTPENFAEMVALSDAFFANQHELKIAMKYLGIKKKEKILEHVGILVVTKGKDGSEILTPSGTLQIPIIKPRKVVDPTGAGDAYRAGFYAGLSRGLDLETCGILGSAASSFAIEAQGPVGKLPTWDEVRQRAGI